MFRAKRIRINGPSCGTNVRVSNGCRPCTPHTVYLVSFQGALPLVDQLMEDQVCLFCHHTGVLDVLTPSGDMKVIKVSLLHDTYNTHICTYVNVVHIMVQRVIIMNRKGEMAPYLILIHHVTISRVNIVFNC